MVLNVRRRQFGIDDHDIGRDRDLAHRGEVALDVVRQLRTHSRVDSMRARVADDQRVAIGRRLGHDVGTDDASGAGMILDKDLLPKRG